MKNLFTLIVAILFVWHNNAIAQASTYVYTGTVQTYTVPAGVTSLTVDTRGGCGGSASYFSLSTYVTADFNRGGYGARVVCSLAVTPGQILNVYVGGNGDSSSWHYTGTIGTYTWDTAHGGWNGGGSSNGYDSGYYYYAYEYYGNRGAGGGGASDIRIGGTALSNRVIVAGGGGGGSFDCSGINENRGGDGGGLTGENGYECAYYYATTCGGGGTPSAGGPGATDYGCTNSGTLGIGGSTDTCGYYYYYYEDYGGGGGGGGYYGGGAGSFGSGGGGSSYTDSTRTTAVVHTRGYNTTRADSIIITVNCSGGVINGITSICAGYTTTLSDTVAGGSGTWSSSNTAVATVGLSTGIVTGLSAGTATITYSVMAYCGSVISVATVTVNPQPVPVVGTTNLCLGLTTGLTDATTPGTWSSGSVGVATVGSATGVVTGAGLGTSVITYTLPTSCWTTFSVSVSALSTPITGTAVICGGATTALGETTTGGTWSTSNPLIASVNITSGLVTGGSVSTVTLASITYTAPGGCTTSRVVTVDPQPTSIGGTGVLCAGSTTALSDIAGGTWSCGPASVATADPASGIVTGVAGGTATVTYVMAGGCSATAVMTINPLPPAITGITSTCIGTVTILTDATTGGLWISSNTAIATVDALSGTLTNILPGSSTISYILSTGCAATVVVTVNLGPLPISGGLTLCPGAATYLSDGIGPGSWSSSNTAIATVDGSGDVYSVLAGTDTISYSLGTGCTVTAVVTVNPLPPPVSGVSEICVGLSTTLTDASTGGTWSSASSSVSVGTSSGSLTGVSFGVAIITYILPTGCSVTKTVTVNTSPPLITGVTHVCPGSETSLIDPAGGTWSSSNTAIATVGSTGVAGGIAAGTTTISYSIGAGCATATTLTVNPLPSAIGGTAVVCAGATTSLSDGSGTWSSGGTAIATVAATGVVGGVAGGTATITFTLPTGCATTRVVTVNPLPSAITGTFALCPGATTILGDLTTGGTWGSGSTAIATVNPTGTIGAVSPGASVVTYTAPVTGCSRTAIVTVNALPAAISGTLSICAGATTTLGDAASGGTWSSGVAGGIATVTPTGTVTGVAAGTAVISYTLGTGCARTTVITINPLPIITGPMAECMGTTMSETTTPAGGEWNSTTTSVATISPAGIVTGAATGTTVILYTSPAGCIALTTVTISLSPTAILGSPTVCANDTMSLSDAIGGGVWTSSNTSIATIGSLSPIVTGVAAGTTIITYSLGTGCTVTKIVTVNAAPLAIMGGMSMCIGSATTLTDATTGGAWSSASPAIATVSATGAVTGAAAGVDTIIYTHAGCAAIATVTVNPTPFAISGTLHVCTGSTTTLSNAVTGGTWTSSNTTIANIDGTGDVSGSTPGTATITYSLGAGCAVSKVVTVNAISAITGSLGICVGATTSLSDAITGGTWGSGAPAIASVNATGLVTGALAGTSTITYTTASGCATNAIVTVNLAPSAISGILHLCAGTTTTLGNTAGGGTWSSSNTSIAPIAAGVADGGIVTGTLSGTATISYSLGSGCITTAVVTVNASPAAILGTLNVCAGSAIPLASGTTGGTWSIGATATATISGSGIVTGVAPGTAVVSYAIGGGCAAAAVITVNALPSPISGGGGSVCVGLTITLTDGMTGGIWSSSNTGIATTDPSAGVITGVSPGPATITYTLPSGCSAATPVSINAAPAPISGAMGICIGSITSLTDPAGSGVWSSGNTAVATIAGSGIVSGIALGTSTISYTVGGCPATAVVTINSLPGAIGGITSVCVGATTVLYDLPDGGTWSSPSGGSIATVDATSGVVTGVAAGMATIAYSLGAGCTVTTSVMVNAVPLPIGGVTEVCLGYTTPLSDASPGVWSSSNTLIATITGSGVVSGVAGGPSTISYTNSSGCAATRLVTVVAVPPILGVSNMCAFSATLPLYDSAAGGFWTSTLASISSSGIVTPYSAGGATITYTLPLGCYTTATLTINPLPGPVIGLNHVCMGSTMPVSDTSSGGAWSSSNTAVAPVSPGGTVSGSSPGVSTISYTIATGCATTETITVDVFPSAGAITGLSAVCAGSDIVLSDGAGSGAWSASNTAAAVFGGLVSGVSAGTDIISYTVSNSCGSATATKIITINPMPAAGTITGLSNVCTGDTIVLADLATGGSWSGTTSVATVLNGIVSGASAGVDTIKYTVSNSCGIAFATKTVTVNSLPNAGTISDIDTICTGTSLTLLDTAAGGVWSSSNSHITITSAGEINAVSAGVDTITYARTNICSTATASLVVAVSSVPPVGIISGSGILCSGSKDTLAVTLAGGDWSSSNGDATITTIPAGIVISGVSAGADTIIYTITNECGPAIAIFPVTVYTMEQCDSMTGVAPSPSAGQAGEVLQVWPNPNDGMFSVILSSNTDEPVLLTITNIVGEKVREVTARTNKATEIKLDDAAGVYFVTAATTQGNYVAKVVFAR